MISILTTRRLGSVFSVVALCATMAGCSLEGQPAPGLAGPSEFGLSVVASAVPDQLLRDGVSQSVVTVTVRGADGSPMAGQSIAVEVALAPGSVRPERVTVSASVITTGPDGLATFAVVAPPSSSTGDQIAVRLAPIGSNADNTEPRRFAVGVYPSNSSAPVAPAGPLGPTSALVGEVVVFNASGATDDGVSCQVAGCTFEWSFGDGTGGQGMVVTKAYSQTGRFPVQLTMRDRLGAETVATHVIEIRALEPATVAVSPNPPVISQAASFAVTLTVPPGVQIDHYDWNWGDGTTSQSTAPTASHTYTNGDARTVTVTVVGAGGTTLSVGILSFTPVPATP